MCTCDSCRATDSAKQWPEYSPDDVRVAKFRRAIDQGKVPRDPVYAQHVSHCWIKLGFKPDLSVRFPRGCNAAGPIPHVWNINDYMRRGAREG